MQSIYSEQNPFYEGDVMLLREIAGHVCHLNLNTSVTCVLDYCIQGNVFPFN